VLDVPETRAMYLRRLRSIMDQFLNGYVQQQFTSNYNTIAAAAIKDNAKWHGGDPALGFKCGSAADWHGAMPSLCFY